MQKHELIAEVDVLLGGRAAEEVFIKEISTGAGNDLERATDIVKSMASIYGMSDIAGLMVLEKRSNQFLGGQTQKDFSDNMAKDLDTHIKTVLNERYEIVLQALRDNSAAIEEMTKELLEVEVISGKRVREVIKANGGVVFEEEDLHSEKIENNVEVNKTTAETSEDKKEDETSTNVEESENKDEKKDD